MDQYARLWVGGGPPTGYLLATDHRIDAYFISFGSQREDSMRRQLMPQEIGLNQGEHYCLLYNNPSDQMAATVRFVKKGLARGEQCVYVADDRTPRDVASALASGGVNVEREWRREALILLGKRDAFLRTGEFDPMATIGFMAGLLGEALASGFCGLRVASEMTWSLGADAGCHRLIEYEALANRHVFAPGTRAVALCQYNRHRFSSAILRDVLRTHPAVVLGEHACSNLYYEPPEMVLGRASEADTVQWMIAQLGRVQSTERALMAANAALESRVAELTAALEAVPVA